MATNQLALDAEIRRRVYDTVIVKGVIPSKSVLAAEAGASEADIRAALARLAEAHMLVLQRNGGEILMANPFSAVPTPFVVTIGKRSWYGNCIWDALGIAAMLHADAKIEASCGCCGTAMKLEVPDECKDGDARVAHFGVPAAHFWDDIVFN